MANGNKAKRNHHWWPVGLQSYWADRNGDVSWIEPDGKTEKKRSARRKIGFKIHGHTLLRGTVWESNFEDEFDIDNEVHKVIPALQGMKPFGRTPNGPVALSCRPRCSFRPPCVRKRQGFSNPMLSVGVADCRSR